MPNETIGPADLGLLPDQDSMTHILKKFSPETAERFANNIFTEHKIHSARGSELMENMIKIAGIFYYLGAKQEAALINQTIDELLRRAEREKTAGLNWYCNTLAAVCKNSISYVREFARKDTAHQGRMQQRERSLKQASANVVEAWENRFRPGYPEQITGQIADD
jgi:hypothetical protein